MQICLSHKSCKTIIMASSEDFNFDLLQEQLGLEPKQNDGRSGGATISDDEIATIDRVINSQTKKALDLTAKKPEEQEPEYLEDYKELLSTKIEIPEDTTDYSQHSVSTFGKDFSHLNSKDAFERELYTREYKNEFFAKADPKLIGKVKDVVEGTYDKAALVREKVAAAMKSNETYTEEAFDARMSLYVDEEGNLNSEGVAKYNTYLNEYKGAWATIQDRADKYAAGEYTRYKELLNSVSSQLKTAKLGGVVLPEELSTYLENNIKSGAHQQWLNEDIQDPEKAALREIKIALISDDVAFAHWFKLMTDLGILHGVNKKAKTIF